jgi:hypothetical protein
VIRRASASALAALLGATLAGAGCGSESPGPVAPPPPPPTTQNAPPVVRAVELEQVRVEAGSALKVTAVVEDAETPVDQLKYEWTASAGSFAGEGREVTWQAPSELEEPIDVGFGVAVVENNSNGTQVNRTTFVVPDSVRVHDSVAELTTLARTFLDDFIDNSVSPSDAVRNFSDSCSGKQSEQRDVQRVRTLFTMLPSSSYSIRSVSIVEPWVRGGIVARCEFRSREKATGVDGIARGTCTLSAVYENNRWMLCDSHFDGPSSSLSAIIR